MAAVAALAAAGPANRGRRRLRRQPNLLFLVADAWRGLALPQAGDPNVQVPNLERLAREGVCCSRVYTSYPVCCPSRAAILTGRLPHAAGVRANHTLLPLEQKTMSAAMKAAGYRTGYIGKWHLDGGENPGFVPPARRRGFDDWYAYNVAHRHYDSVYFRDDPAAPVQTSGFEPDVVTDLAIDFLRKDRGSERPFYLYLSFVAPHAPLTPPARYAEKYRPAAIQLRQNVPNAVEAEARRDAAGYYGLCSAVDENVGRLLRELDTIGAAEDTIAVFTADHGQTLWSHGVDEIDLPYEETARIPLLIRYPRGIRAGSTHDGLISNIDFAPTLMALCGVTRPEGMHMQGANHAKRLTSVGGARDRSDASIYAEGGLGQKHEWRMVVQGRYKLVVDSGLRPTRLFDLVQDPGEQQNLVDNAAFASIIGRLQAVRQQWASRTGDRLS